MVLKFLKDRLIIVIALITLVFFFYSFFIVKKQTIFADGAGYFSYPYELIQQGNLSYSSPSASTIFGVTKLDNSYINKYPIGTGIFLLPAFFCGEVANLLTNNSQANLYTQNYQFFVGFWGIVYLLLGTLVLKKILNRFFSKEITSVTLIASVFATNLFIYGSADASFSHIYSFLCINLFLLFLIKWNSLPNLKNSLLLGLFSGLAILLRQSNISIIILFIFYGINLNNLKQSLKTRVEFYKINIKKVCIILVVSLFIFVPQILYWLIYTNHILIFSYGKESFDFLRPHILDVLFSIKRGVLVWHPIFILFIAGLFLLKRKIPELATSALVFILINFFIIASWWNWDYGIGFGHRAFTDYLGIFALGFASLIGTYWNNKNKKKTLIITLGLLISINIILSISYVQQRNSSPVPTINTYLNSFLQFHL